MVKDPVCGMMVDPETAPAIAEYQGQTYCFCAPGCKGAFEKDPEKYLEADASGEEHHHGR
jgi:Cu+-exporting ATPase